MLPSDETPPSKPRPTPACRDTAGELIIVEGRAQVLLTAGDG